MEDGWIKFAKWKRKRKDLQKLHEQRQRTRAAHGLLWMGTGCMGFKTGMRRLEEWVETSLQIL